MQRLQRRGLGAVLTHEPGGTPLGEALRRVLKSGPAMSPLSELFLFEAARAQLVDTLIRPALAVGRTVIADRYVASTVAYQAYGRELDRNLVDRLNREATGGLMPDLTVLLDLSVDTSLSRIQRAGNDNFDQAPREFHRRVREGYKAQAEANPDKWLVLDGTRAKRDLSRQIWEKVQPIL
jgi:dTMP kinase